jgi:CBS domain-containing protein
VNTPICEAARLLVEQKIGGVPIVDQGKLVGIVTTSDLLATLMVDEECAQFASVA